ncbi:NAD-dependent epimerase/dehydratase family protein [Paenibacillus radicis (ex Xue et al. 2023)]|uniref:NAD-dependent epimerase/dehydratase family protein n=1 Tax=Paenibacillus radicis (ex Xue et al. 2023) TaxID=2972489 RepID=A0ABT1YSB7_9BACL|nr:NAD-dependent epimerase/dehydratase family protein [Paenibacillus radicis (ex Xue et al. 2023)]MCR8636077.1 NAD-dependent epimerase/dehydratase family protein [Paenibacillus radicis (ex Xue et al. 2023)]
MKILVTGGAGFIGSHLTDALIAHGAEVHVIDNLSTGIRSHVHPQALLHIMDIRSQEAIEAIQRIRPELVFHHAAQVDVQHSVKEPANDAGINIAGTVNVLEACRLAGVRKVVYASSCAVYGDNAASMVKETDPIIPISYYGISKYTPEAYLRVYRELYGLSYTVLRYANVYGPRQTPKGEGGVVAIFMERLLHKKPMIVFGDGEQTRDFVCVHDVVRANLAAIHRGDQETLHVSTAIRTSVNTVAAELQRIHGAPLELVYAAERLGDIRHSCLDNSCIASSLGWSPIYTLRLGLEETYRHVMSDS